MIESSLHFICIQSSLLNMKSLYYEKDYCSKRLTISDLNCINFGNDKFLMKYKIIMKLNCN